MKYKEGITRDVWKNLTVESVEDVFAFFNGKDHISPKTINDLFESENFDTDYDTVVQTIYKDLRSARLSVLDGNAIHIAHSPRGRIDLVINVGTFAELVSYNEKIKEGTIRIWLDIVDSANDEIYNFGFIADVKVTIYPSELSLDESKKTKKNRLTESLSSEVKTAYENVIKNGEEFDIPFKYSNEWEFTDEFENFIEKKGFSFEESFIDKNYGLVYKYSDNLETMYVIIDKSLSSRGINVGIVTEL